eukprot:412920-Pleurochrysis_carterae.AAC.1
MDTSKRHQIHMIIRILTTPLVGAPILEGAASCVPTALQFHRPYWAGTTGLYPSWHKTSLEATIDFQMLPCVKDLISSTHFAV